MKKLFSTRGLVGCAIALAAIGCGTSQVGPLDGSTSDSGVRDSGAPNDAAVPPDSGVPSDSGSGAPLDAAFMGDGGVPSDGGLGLDAGLPMDIGATPDGARFDTGAPIDAGTRADGGTAGADGGDPSVNAEGHTCTPGGTGQGSCADPRDVCFTWTPQNTTTPLATCIHPCGSAADCRTSAVGPVCAGVAFAQAAWTVLKACVTSSISIQGAIATTSQLHTTAAGNPIPMTGCADGLTPVYRLSGSLLVDLGYDQVSCGLPCAVDGDCTSAAPSCTPSVYTSTLAVATKQGLCTTRRAAKGAKCSERKATEMCDVSVSPSFVCLDLGDTNADNMAAAAADERYGICLEICDTAVTTCRAHVDPAHTGVCKFGFFTNPNLGVCSDGCSSYPDNCIGMGSPPAAGASAQGATCFEFRGVNGTVDVPEESLCIDVDQTGPLFAPLTNFAMLPAVNCDTNAISCPARTECLGLGDPQMHSGCVYGCSSTVAFAQSGCQGTGTATCTKAFGAGLNAGVCSN